MMIMFETWLMNVASGTYGSQKGEELYTINLWNGMMIPRDKHRKYIF